VPTRFYRNDQQWITLAEQLKLTLCPHCHKAGNLIQHGYLYGYDDSSPQRQTRRAHRIFCSNRNLRSGCGRTFSIWLADKIRRLSLSAHTLWAFLQHAAAGSIVAAIHAVRCHLCDRSWFRIWKRFHQHQCQIRSALRARCPPPPDTSQRPDNQTLAHLQAAFPNDNCPIASFQYETNTFFI
jgi:hypothetical protein